MGSNPTLSATTLESARFGDGFREIDDLTLPLGTMGWNHEEVSHELLTKLERNLAGGLPSSQTRPTRPQTRTSDLVSWDQVQGRSDAACRIDHLHSHNANLVRRR